MQERDTGAATVYQIAGWNENFETKNSRPIKRKSLGSFPLKQDGLGYKRNMLQGEDGVAIYGAFVAVAVRCHLHRPPRDGWITEDGREDGPLLTVEDLSALTCVPEPLLCRMFEVLSSKRIGWIIAHARDQRGTSAGPAAHQRKTSATPARDQLQVSKEVTLNTPSPSPSPSPSEAILPANRHSAKARACARLDLAAIPFIAQPGSYEDVQRIAAQHPVIAAMAVSGLFGTKGKRGWGKWIKVWACVRKAHGEEKGARLWVDVINQARAEIAQGEMDNKGACINERLRETFPECYGGRR